MKRLLLPAILLSAVLAPTFAFAAAVPPATGTWKIIGDVQGTTVLLTCALVEDDHKLTGTCAGADDKIDHQITGTIKDMALAWQFDTQYGGNPITVKLNAAMDPDGAKMSGTLAVVGMDATGDFNAIRQ